MQVDIGVENSDTSGPNPKLKIYASTSKVQGTLQNRRKKECKCEEQDREKGYKLQSSGHNRDIG